jgi:hypothetical protein|tara:strand:+ start:8323 stop:8442 length:120 start_codon:yes stop_codon:yes gene_type:complete
MKIVQFDTQIFIEPQILIKDIIELKDLDVGIIILAQTEL